MKCIKSKDRGQVFRVPDSLAHHMVVVTKEFVYVPKSEWKQLRQQRKGN